MRPFIRGFAALCSSCLLSAFPARADTLAPGDPAELMDLDVGFITGLTQPTALAFLPDGKILVTQKTGALKVFDADGSPLGDATEHFVAARFDVDTESEKGLLNVLVHPNFESNRLLFLYYSSAATGDADKNRLVTVPLGEDYVLDMAAEQILLQDVWGPRNHDGGALSIANGKLYVGVGDSGCNKSPIPAASEPRNYYATCLSNVNGKILRVNLDGSIPEDNPLVGVDDVTSCEGTCPDPTNGTDDGQRCSSTTTSPNHCDGRAPTGLAAPRTEIWAWGFRNPWRIWADPVTDYVWVGDVGEQHYEEINLVTRPGTHFGWPFREGRSGDPQTACAGSTVPDSGDCIDPLHIYGHVGGGAVTGGPIVDHCAWPESLRHTYYFGDSYQGTIWSRKVNAARDGFADVRKDFVTELPKGPGAPVSFTFGPDGALYYVSITGYIARIAPKNPLPCEPPNGEGGEGGTPAGGSAGAAAGGGGGNIPSGGSGGVPNGGNGGLAGASASGGQAGTTSTGGRGDAGEPGAAGTAVGGASGHAPAAGASSSDGCACRVGRWQGGGRLGLLALAAGASALGLRRRPRRG